MTHDMVQVRNPRSGRYILIDRSAGVIVARGRTSRPYKGVRIVSGR